MRRLILSIFAVLLLSNVATAQQDPQYSMYMFNRYVVNPAYAGALEATNITVLGRSQWVGIDGAPNTSTASINAYVPKLHGGIGAYIIGDKLGPISTFGAKAAYSFHLDIGRAKLNIGAGGGIYQKALDQNGWVYNMDNGADPILLNGGGTNTLRGDLDAGLYFHIPLNVTQTTAYPQDKFYVGVSASHLLEPTLNDLLQNTTTQPDAWLSRNIVATAGYTIPLNKRTNTVFLQPSVNFRAAGNKATIGANPSNVPVVNKQLDINMNLYISPMVFGISHRGMILEDNDSWVGIIGFNASSNLFMAYSFDYTTSNLAGFNTGSHELVVSYTFPSKTKRLAPIDGVRIKSGGQL